MKVKTKRKNIAVIFVCVFLALVLAFGITLGIIAAVRNANAVYTYNGTVMDRKVAAFFTSRYKVKYFSAVKSEGFEPTDDVAFWQSEYKDGVSFGENFDALLDEHLKEILVSNYIFDNCRSLNDEDKSTIEKTVYEVLDYKANGDVAVFNEMAEPYGFDYDSFKTAVTMQYKASSAFIALFGDEGVNISADATACGSYLNEYSHVSLIIVREGTKLKSAEGEGDKNVFLDSNERAKRKDYIDLIHNAILAYKTGGDGKMTVTSFENWLDDEENSAIDMREDGFYFNENAERTAEFAEIFPDVVKRAYEMELHTFDEVEMTVSLDMEGGDIYEEKLHVFMYKYPPREGAYADKEASEYWFSDFYTDAAVYIFGRYLNEYREGVVGGGYFDSFDGRTIPINNEITPRF